MAYRKLEHFMIFNWCVFCFLSLRCVVLHDTEVCFGFPVIEVCGLQEGAVAKSSETSYMKLLL